MKSENLMKKALNTRYSSKERAESFNKIYFNYIKENGENKDWNKFQIKLRKKYSNKLNDLQKNKFGLDIEEVKKAYFELKKNISKKKRSFFPVEIFYENGFSLIEKITKGNEKILEIGFGNYPILINILNKKGYSMFGIEPFAKSFDKKRTFKATIKDIPKIIEQKFDLILINMVYSINYTFHFQKNFHWELKNKKELIKKISSLIKQRGYLILIDDLGTIFSKKDLKKHFKIILYEKDIPVINFDKNKTEGFQRINLLVRK